MKPAVVFVTELNLGDEMQHMNQRITHVMRHYGETGWAVHCVYVGRPESRWSRRRRVDVRVDEATGVRFVEVQPLFFTYFRGPRLLQHCAREVARLAAPFLQTDVHHMNASTPWGGLIAQELGRILGVKRMVYEDHDSFADFFAPKMGSWVRELEVKLVEEATVVVSVSRFLAAYRRRLTGKMPVVRPNGHAFPAPAEVRDQGTRAGVVYAGSLAAWTNAYPMARAVAEELCRAGLARAHGVTLVGQGAPEARAPVHQLVTQVGYVPYPALPGLLGRFLLGLIPFRRGPLALYSFPLKMCDYIGAGLPFVGVDQGEIGAIARTYACGAVVDEEAEVPKVAVSLLRDEARWRALQRAALDAGPELRWQNVLRDYPVPD